MNWFTILLIIAAVAVLLTVVWGLIRPSGARWDDAEEKQAIATSEALGNGGMLNQTRRGDTGMGFGGR